MQFSTLAWQQRDWLKEERAGTHLCERKVKQGDIDRHAVFLDPIKEDIRHRRFHAVHTAASLELSPRAGWILN